MANDFDLEPEMHEFFRGPTFVRKLDAVTESAVDFFCAHLKDKLLRAGDKYGYTDQWSRDGWTQADCAAQLAEHVQKGDPLDVGAYAVFCHARGWSTKDERPAPRRPGVRHVIEVYFFSDETGLEACVRITSPVPLPVTNETMTPAKLLAHFGHGIPEVETDWRFMTDEEIAEYRNNQDED